MTSSNNSPIGLEDPNYLQEHLVPAIIHSLLEHVNATTGGQPNNLRMFRAAAYIMYLVTSIVSQNISQTEAADYETIKEQLLAEVERLSSPNFKEEQKRYRKIQKNIN